MTNSEPDLVADIGGTNARFAIVGEDRRPLHTMRLACSEFSAPEDAVRHFLSRTGEKVSNGAFAIAAPVSGDDVVMTNHPWRFSVKELGHALGFRHFQVVNDFEAVALSLPALGAADVVGIGGGEIVKGAAKAVLGPGTGLGVSGLIPGAAGSWSAVRGEGGHVDFAPGNAREAAVLAELWVDFSHVSLERVLSGPGLVSLYGALCRLDGVEVGAAAPQPSEVVTLAQAANPQAVEAAGMFSAVLGSAAGDLALTLGACGGVFLAGGVTTAMGSCFDRVIFRRRFEEKGRFRAYLEKIPTLLITVPNPALIGLAALLRSGMNYAPD